MSTRGDGIPSTLRLWIIRILWERRKIVFAVFSVTIVASFLLVSPPSFNIRGPILPHPWRSHTPFDETFGLPVGKEVWAERAQAVKRAFIHAYEPYESITFPFDELLPLTNRSVNKLVSYSHRRGSKAAVPCSYRLA